MDNDAEFISAYLTRAANAIFTIPPEGVAQIGQILLNAFESGSQVFIAGNGGSASLASHLACDLAKTVCGKNPRACRKRFRVISLADNVATLTAWANDECYSCIFSEPLKNNALPSDVLIVISASGNSPNILEALRTAKRIGMKTIALLGFGGGKGRPLADESIVIESHDYGVVEGAHDVLSHLITSWLARQISLSEPEDRIEKTDQVAV